MSALVLLNILAKLWYSDGILSILLGATEVGVVLSEDIHSWKVSELFNLQMQAKAAAFTRAIYGAFNFGGVRGSTGGAEIGLGKVADATRAAGDIKIRSGHRGVRNVILPIAQSINRL
jgi:hypothetical protein